MYREKTVGYLRSIIRDRCFAAKLGDPPSASWNVFFPRALKRILLSLSLDERNHKNNKWRMKSIKNSSVWSLNLVFRCFERKWTKPFATVIMEPQFAKCKYKWEKKQWFDKDEDRVEHIVSYFPLRVADCYGGYTLNCNSDNITTSYRSSWRRRENPAFRSNNIQRIHRAILRSPSFSTRIFL